MIFSDLFDVEYISIGTYRQNDQLVRTTVWQTPENGKMYVWTLAKSGKVKRIRKNCRVRVCVCDMVGHPLSEWTDAQADMLTDPAVTRRQVGGGNQS